MSIPILAFWTDLLCLPNYEVVYCQKESDLQRYRLTVAPKQRLGVCPHCGKISDTIHQTRTREHIKDLPIGKEAVDLNVRVLQFECVCGQHFTPAVPFLAEGAHATERFLEQARRLIGFSDIANVAAFLQLPENTLARWYYDYVERLQQQPASPPAQPIRQLGIDELCLKKSTVSSSPS